MLPVKALLSQKVAIAWLLIVVIACGAIVIVWKLAIHDAPPGGTVFVQGQQSDGPSATITPFGVAATKPVVNTPGAVDARGGSTATGTSPGPTLAAATGSKAYPTSDATSAESPTLVSSPASTSVAMISVYVSGDVAKPGVYAMPDGSRVNDAVIAAGGALPDADLEQINLAQKLTDEQHISVFKIGDSARPTTTAGQAASSTTRQPGPTSGTVAGAKTAPGTKINVNTATAQELELVPGIGPVTAQRIITDREQNGPFKSVDDLTRIPGIKAGILAKVRDYLTVGP
jgi:competence protein ComEA